MRSSLDRPRTSIRRRCVFAALLTLAACDADVPSSPDPDAAEPRTFQMGFGPTPPRATLESLIETIEEVAEVSELALIQQPVPWAALLDGTQAMEEALAERERLVEFLDGLGLEVVFLLDPLDGLDRRREPPELESYGFPPDREAALANFSRMGIVDVDFNPKPAFAVWGSTRARPLEF